MDLFCGFKVFIVFITCLFKQKIALDNYSWLHRRFIGEHGKPTLGGCGWRQGSLTLSFMCYFFYDWAYDYDCHVPFGYVSPSDHPLQFYKVDYPKHGYKHLVYKFWGTILVLRPQKCKWRLGTCELLLSQSNFAHLQTFQQNSVPATWKKGESINTGTFVAFVHKHLWYVYGLFSLGLPRSYSSFGEHHHVS
jgi:hypothetical protein